MSGSPSQPQSQSDYFSPVMKAERLQQRQPHSQQQPQSMGRTAYLTGNNQPQQQPPQHAHHSREHSFHHQPRFTFDAAATSAANFSLLNAQLNPHHTNNGRQSSIHPNPSHSQYDQSGALITTASIVDPLSQHLSFAQEELLKSTARCKGNSCHQCKTNKEPPHLYFCTAKNDHPMGKRNCRKKYCLACMSRWYKGLLHTGLPGHQPSQAGCTGWLCPSCTGVCVCAACDRKKDKKKQQEIADDPDALTRINGKKGKDGNNGSKRDRSEIMPSDNPSGSSSPIAKSIKMESVSPLLTGSGGDLPLIPKLESISEMSELGLSLPSALSVYTARVHTDPSDVAHFTMAVQSQSNQRNSTGRPPLPLSLYSGRDYSDSHNHPTVNTKSQRSRGSTRASSKNTMLPNLPVSYSDAVHQINKYYEAINAIHELDQRKSRHRSNNNHYDIGSDGRYNHRNSVSSDSDAPPSVDTFSSSSSSQVSTPTLMPHGSHNHTSIPYHHTQASLNEGEHKQMSSMSASAMPNIGALFESSSFSLSTINTPSLASPAISVPCSPRTSHAMASLSSNALADIHSDPFNPSPLFNPGLSLNGDDFQPGAPSGTQTPSFWLLKSATNSVTATPRNALGETDFNALFSN